MVKPVLGMSLFSSVLGGDSSVSFLTSSVNLFDLTRIRATMKSVARKESRYCLSDVGAILFLSLVWRVVKVTPGCIFAEALIPKVGMALRSSDIVFNVKDLRGFFLADLSRERSRLYFL